MKDRTLTTALVALAEHGIPADVQELLIRGDATRGIPPGALQKAIVAIDDWRSRAGRLHAAK